MKFKRLEIQNFMSVTSTEIDLDNQGLVLIQGSNIDEDAFDSNGAGKSAIFSEAPCWCLFGETIRGLKADGIINRKAKKDTRVNLVIEADNGDIYEVIRHRKHNEHKNNVLLYKNTVNITAKSDKDTNVLIQNLIQMDYLTFTNSIMFGQGLAKMFASSTDGEQKRILEQILQIDVFKSCQDRAKNELANIDTGIRQHDTTIASLGGQKRNLEDSIQTLEIKEAELQDKVELRIRELMEDNLNYQAELEDLPVVSVLQDKKKRLAEECTKCDDTIESFSEFTTYQVQLLGSKESLSNEINKGTRVIQKLQKQLTGLLTGKDVPSVCDKCGQALPLNDTSSIEKHLRDDIKENEKTIIGLEEEIENTDSLLQSINAKLEGKKVHEVERDTLLRGISRVDSDIRMSLQQEKSILKAILNVEKAIQEQETLLGTTYVHLIEENKVKVGDLAKQIVDTQKLIGDLDERKSKYNFWVNAFGNQGIKSILLDSVTPYLNQRANHYLSRLSDSSIEVQFNTQTTLKNGEKRDKFSIDVINANGDSTYGGNSGGEKRRIDISVSMALQDLVQSRSNNSIDLVVYDEAFENLDAIGCQNVIEILQEKATTCGSVMVITHNDDLKQLFNKNIVVEKTGGQTEVKYVE